MLPDRVSNPGPLTYESGALPIALRGPAYQLLYMRKLLHMMWINRPSENKCNDYEILFAGTQC